MSGGVKLTWNVSEGADGYLIYGKTNSTAYGYVGMTSGTQYIDKAAPAEEYKFYWIYPYYYNQSGKRIITTTPDYVYGKAAK